MKIIYYIIIIVFISLLFNISASIFLKNYMEPNLLLLIIPISGRIILSYIYYRKTLNYEKIIRFYDYLTITVWIILLVGIYSFGTVPKNNPDGWSD